MKNPKYEDIHEKISKCINEKRDTTVGPDPDWVYWRTILIQIEEGELVNDIEEKYPNLLQDERIDISNVGHKAYDEFGIIGHDACKNILFEKIDITLRDRIGVGRRRTIQDDYFEKYKVLEKIKRYHFSDIRRHEECKILKTLYKWLQKYGDNGFCLKGYDVKQHLELVSLDYFNDDAKDGYILLYSQIHNAILYIDTNPDDIKKSMKNNRLNIRPLRSANPCLDGASFVYIPVTLFNPNEHIIDEKIICKLCIDKKLVVSSETFKDIDLFENWWENISSMVEDIACELSEKVDISNRLLKSILTYMALDSFSLPSFTKNSEQEIIEVQKLQMFIPEQQDIIYSKNKHKIIKGSYGTGTTIVAQQIFKLVSDSSDGSDLLHYLIRGTESSFLKEIKKVKFSNFSKITFNNKKLSTLLEYLLVKGKGKRIHVFIDEYDGETLNKTEVTLIKTILQREEYKNSHIVVVAQPMETERCETDDSFQTSPYENYKYELLVEETDFKIFHLSYLLRSSKYINDIVSVTIPYLEKARMKSVIPKLDLKYNSKSEANIFYANINQNYTNNFNSAPSLNIMTEVPRINAKREIIQEIGIKSTTNNIKGNKYSSESGIESSYRIVGNRETAHNVKGMQPVIYYPFLVEHKNKSHQLYCLSKVLNLLLDSNKRQAIICFNTDSIDIIRNSLNISGIKWTNDLESLSTDECLLADYADVRGCEFLNVILILSTGEEYLTLNIADGISRSIFNLRLIVLSQVDADETIVAIIDEWVKRELVVVSNEDYLKIVTKEELNIFEESYQDLFKKQYGSQVLDKYNDVEVVPILQSLDRSSYESDIDLSSSNMFDWRRFARLISVSEDEIEVIKLKYEQNYERVYQCILSKSSDQMIIDWKLWRDKLLKLSNGGEITDIIESTFYKQLNLKEINNQVHIYGDNEEELIIVAHNANIEENFWLLPFEIKKEENLKKYENKEVNCNILKTCNRWIEANKDGGFAVKGYDAKQHLKQVTIDPYEGNVYKDSYILLYSEKHNLILHVDTDPVDINIAVRNNRTNVRYLRTVHGYLVGKYLVYVPVVLYDTETNNNENVCEYCKKLQLVVPKNHFEKLDLLENWFKNIEKRIGNIAKNIGIIAKSIRKPNQVNNNIAKEFLCNISNFMSNLDNLME